jgi:hypothetical protein
MRCGHQRECYGAVMTCELEEGHPGWHQQEVPSYSWEIKPQIVSWDRDTCEQALDRILRGEQ